MRLSLPLLFDVALWLALALVHGVALATGLAVFDLFGDSLAARVTGALSGFFVYLHVFVLVLGVLKRLVQPSLVEGRTPVGANRAYLAWGLNSVLQGVFLSSPFIGLVQLLFSLRYLHLRLFGMQLSLGSVIGIGSELRQVELIELGEGSTIGLRAVLSCHISENGRVHRQGRIRIGKRSLVGAFSRLAPGVVVGDDALVGTNTTLSEDVIVGDRARIGAHCFVRRGVRIGEGARIESGAVISADVAEGAYVRAASSLAEQVAA